eukprot:10145548-Alexandrium_andersonii.AAC.1
MAAPRDVLSDTSIRTEMHHEDTARHRGAQQGTGIYEDMQRHVFAKVARTDHRADTLGDNARVAWTPGKQ